MRVTIFSLAIIAAGLLGATQTASAQSAYNYPWCSIDNTTGRVLDGGLGGGSGPSCYYQTREQCMASGIQQLGNCYPNLQYRPFPGGLPPLVVDTTARTVESYRWCAIGAANQSARDCHYDSLAECKTTMSGVEGNCYPNPYYRPAAAAPPPAAAAPRGQVVAKKRSTDRNDR